MAGPWWKQNPYLSNLYGIGEAAATIGGGMLTQSGAGLAGLAGWLAGASPEERARIIEEAMQQSPYLMDPGSAEGQQIVQGLGYLMSPVQKAGDWLATASEQAGGSPLAMSIAKTIPDAALWGLGAPGMLRGGQAISRGAEALTGRVADLAATGPGAYRAQSGARPVYGPAQAPAPAPALLPGGEVRPIPEPGPVSPLKRWGAQAGALNPDAPNPFYANLGTAIRNRPGAEPLPPEGSQRPFYSVLYDAVNELPEKGTPQEMVSILKKKGVKQAEIDAFLLPELFAGQWSYNPGEMTFTEQVPVPGQEPRLVTKDSIKAFISPKSYGYNDPGPGSVFDVTQYRLAEPHTGLEKFVSPAQQAEIEDWQSFSSAYEDLRNVRYSEWKQDADNFAAKWPEFYSSWLDQNDPIQHVYGTQNTLGLARNVIPWQSNSDNLPSNDSVIYEPAALATLENLEDYMTRVAANNGMNYQPGGLTEEEIRYKLDGDIREAVDTIQTKLKRKAFREAFDNPNSAYTGNWASDFVAMKNGSFTYRTPTNQEINEIEKKEILDNFSAIPGLNERLQRWYDMMVDKLNFSYNNPAAAELDYAQVQIDQALQQQQKISEAPKESAYKMVQLFKGPGGKMPSGSGGLARDTVMETMLGVPPEWINSGVYAYPYHNFESGTVVFNRTTQRPVLYSPGSSTRYIDQVQSDINQAARRKLNPYNPNSPKFGYQKARAPMMLSDTEGTPISREDMINFGTAEERAVILNGPGTKPEAPPMLPFSDTKEWSRLGIAQAFADAIEAGDQYVSISPPMQHYLAHDYTGSLVSDTPILWMNIEEDSPSNTPLGRSVLASNDQSLTSRLNYGPISETELRMKILESLESDYTVRNANLEISAGYLESLRRANLLNAAYRIENDRRFVSADDPQKQRDIDAHLYYLAGEIAYALRNENYSQIPSNWQNEYRSALRRIGDGLDNYVQKIPAGTIVPNVSTDAGRSGAGVGSFYGREAKKALADFAKEVDKDAKVVVKSVPVFADGEKINVDSYSVEITDKMREQYRNKGFKLFTPAIAGGYLMEQTLRAEIEKRRKAMLED